MNGNEREWEPVRSFTVAESAVSKVVSPIHIGVGAPMRRVRKRQRPGNAEDLGDGMKLHVRSVEAAGRRYRLVTLRPGTRAAFSTNRFHHTWHILSDLDGARLLARLLWGLSYQRLPGTMVLVHGEHLFPTPFDADPSDPILLTSGHLTPFDRRSLRELRDRLAHLGNPDQTIRWRTFGLDLALKDPRTWFEANRLPPDWSGRVTGLWSRERMDRCGGFLCYNAPAVILRRQAICIHGMHVRPGIHNEMDYHYLALGGGFPPAGEVQIFENYRTRLSSAAVARREVLAELDPRPSAKGVRNAVQARERSIRSRPLRMRP
jgi:hypothetical protein